MPRPLNPKQQRFASEFLVDMNATQAAIRAGYSERTARQHASDLMAKPDIQAAITAGKAAVAAAVGASAEQVLNELALIALSDIGEVLDFTGPTLRMRAPCDIPERARRAIASIKIKRQIEGRGDLAHEVEFVEFKLWNKDAALDKLGKYHQLWTERVEHTGKDGGPLDFRIEWGNDALAPTEEEPNVPRLA